MAEHLKYPTCPMGHSRATGHSFTQFTIGLFECHTCRLKFYGKDSTWAEPAPVGLQKPESVSPEWIEKEVKSRKDLPPACTRVLMFIRGVGWRMGTVTRAFEIPWKIYDPEWMGCVDQPLTAVHRYINIDSLPTAIERNSK